MAKNSNKTYWPHMIVGFLVLAITLSYWTIRAASSMPVQETNDYMMKYQVADININDILNRQRLFDENYSIKLLDREMMVMIDNIHSNKIQNDQVKLSMGQNSFTYLVTDKQGNVISDINASFLLTRPHSTRDDYMIEVIKAIDGKYTTPQIEISNPGRYTLQFRARIGDAVGFISSEAYLKPNK